MKRLLVSLVLLAAPLAGHAQTPAAPPAAAPAAAEEQSFNAFAVAAVQGTIVRAGEQKAMMVGTLAGLVFVETDEGPVEAGKVSCAASMQLDSQSRELAGSGICTFTAADGATSWGNWECAGYELVGCRGKLTLTGGTGRLQGASGGGSMLWRPSARASEKQADGTMQIGSTGILIWRDFKVGKGS